MTLLPLPVVCREVLGPREWICLGGTPLDLAISDVQHVLAPSPIRPVVHFDPLVPFEFTGRNHHHSCNGYLRMLVVQEIEEEVARSTNDDGVNFTIELFEEVSPHDVSSNRSAEFEPFSVCVYVSSQLTAVEFLRCIIHTIRIDNKLVVVSDEEITDRSCFKIHWLNAVVVGLYGSHPVTVPTARLFY